ncbi:DUF1361 domain-containing protein [Saccharibacillus sp. CPCC 101409]|uniref:DUF1361 domain-containing protein n=1 Tax=Saccharibacillus sp. CPCC 101409 TaxID=3058041 RepID=UPI00267363E6|nr:DUF1361 domain-containing protein [Saccharibacillus sp. CPCC 101409]MDO3410802.1 DUF1361 domain-containing protein [Saccharibacillus sp. CPCC 101409]
MFSQQKGGAAIGPKSPHRPWKLYIWLFLLLLTAIDLAVLLDIRTDGGGRPYRFMLWNFFLAWISAGTAAALDGVCALRQTPARTVLLPLCGLVWLFFYPNAAYLLTDLLHVFKNYAFDPQTRFWSDIAFWHHLLPMLLAALIGLLIAGVSLFSVQRLVASAYGAAAGGIFAAAALLLASFGIYMGRFVRWNSWDVVSNPLMLMRDMRALLGDPSWVRHLLMFGGGVFVITGGLYAVLILFGKMSAEVRSGER